MIHSCFIVSYSRAWVHTSSRAGRSYFLWEIFFQWSCCTTWPVWQSGNIHFCCYHKDWLIKLVEIETMCSSSKEERGLTVIKLVKEVQMIQCLSAISYRCFLQASSVPIETVHMYYHPSSSLRAKCKSSSLNVIPFSSWSYLLESSKVLKLFFVSVFTSQ